MPVAAALRFRVSALLSLWLPALLAAAPASIEERLDRLERELAAVRAENADLRSQLGEAAPRPAGLAVVPAGQETDLRLGGYTQLNAEFGDAPDARFDPRDRFLVRRARFGLRGNWREPVSFKLEADFGNNSLSGRSSYSAQLTDAYADYTFAAGPVLRLGQFKTPFGYEQLTADTRLLTIERSLANDRLTLGRQIGLGLSGDLASERINYAFGVFNGSGANQGFNDNNRFLAAARLGATVLRREPFRLASAVNAFTSRDDATAFAGDREGLGLDLQADYGPWAFQGELLQVRHEPLLGRRTRSTGWSALAAWRLPWPAWQAVARFENHEADTHDADTRSETLTLGLIHRLLGDDLRLSVNYLLGDPAGPGDDQSRLLTSAQLVF